MRSASVQLLALAACSHALLAPPLRRTAGAKVASSLRRTTRRKAAPYSNELRALAGVAAAAKLGTREPCAKLWHWLVTLAPF